MLHSLGFESLGMIRMSGPAIGVVAVMVSASLFFGQAACQAGEPDSTLSTLRQGINAEVHSYERAADAVCGIYIVDLRDGTEITKFRAGRKLIPGSNMKLYTAAFALAELGPDYEFITRVYQLGKDIVVVGNGDSTLGAPSFVKEIGEGVYTELDRWAAAVKEKAGERFTGDLIMCSQFKLTQSRPPAWGKQIYHFEWAPPTGGLNYYGNLLYVTAEVKDGKVLAQTEPQSRFFKVVNKLEAGETTSAVLKANEDDSVFELTGTVAKDKKESFHLPINQPELYTGRVLAERLVVAGVPFAGKVRYVKSSEIDLKGAKLLYEKKTSMTTAFRWTNIRSLQMPAECLFLSAGDRTWENSAKLLKESLVKNYGLDPDDFEADEGSGISAIARLMPKDIVHLLKAFLERKGGQLVVQSIPLSGTEGTMTSSLADPQYKGRARGKIGHSYQGYCLSGYILDKAGKPRIVYSIMANDMEPGKETGGKPMQMAICKLLVDYLDAGK